MKAKSNTIRDKIADTAMHLFKSKGYGISISEICEKAGVTRSSFYNQFSSKDDILSYLMESANDLSRNSFDDFVYADNDFERLWMLVDNRLKIIEDYKPELGKAIFKLELERDLGIISLTEPLRIRIKKLYKNCILQGIAECSYDPDLVIDYGERMTNGIIFEWVRSGGAFDLRAESRRANEMMLGLKKEYRKMLRA